MMTPYSYYKKRQSQKGFTLIELLVSSSIFLIIVSLGISSLLMMHRAYKITQFQKEQFDTLSAIMEDMVRNIRVGRHIRCDVGGDYSNSIIEEPKSCVDGTTGTDVQASLSLAFEGVAGQDGVTDDQVGYVIAEDPDTSVWSVFKTLGPDITTLSVANYNRLTPSPITIIPANSGFSVIYAESADREPPLVTIRLAGTIAFEDTTIPFSIQTAVMQRTPKD